MAMGPDPSAQIAADAASAKKMGIIAIVLTFCCGCGLGGLIVGYLAMNKGNAALAAIAQTGMGQQYASDANTGKICGIIGMALGVLGIIIGIVYAIMSVVVTASQQG